MVLLLLTFCLLLLPLWGSVIVLCFVERYLLSILVLQSSWWRRESWLLCFICLPGVSWWLSGSSSGYHGVVCSLWLWYFLIILIYYFCGHLLGTGWPLGSRLWCLIVFLSLSRAVSWVRCDTTWLYQFLIFAALFNFKAVWILIRWLHQKPAELGLYCFLKSIKRVQQDKDIPAILSYNTAFTDLPTQRDSDVIFCLQLLIQTLTCTHHLS